MNRYALYVLSRSALPLARSLAQALEADVYAPVRFAPDGVTGFEGMPELVGQTFSQYAGHIFIAASGIAVRAIAPHLRSKAVDPAVVVMDPGGRNVISLLSGHLGGANELARQCAAISGGRAVITTATDCAGVPSLDMMAQEHGVRIGNANAVKAINAALLEGCPVQVYDPLGCLGDLDTRFFVNRTTLEEWHEGEPGVLVHWKILPKTADTLHLYPPVLAVGVGCRRGTPSSEIHEFLLRVLQKHGLAIESVAVMGSADIKQDESGLLLAAEEFGLPLEFFPADQLKAMDPPTPSSLVESHVGTPGVCEAAAQLLSEGGELLVSKQKTSRVTIAVARRKKCS